MIDWDCVIDTRILTEIDLICHVGSGFCEKPRTEETRTGKSGSRRHRNRVRSNDSNFAKEKIPGPNFPSDTSLYGDVG